MAKISLFSEIILGLDVFRNSILDFPTRYFIYFLNVEMYALVTGTNL